MTWRARRALGLATLLPIACSKAAYAPEPASCVSDEDCNEGEVCATDQGSVCVLFVLPDPKVVGVHVVEESVVVGDARFFVDVIATDKAVREITSTPPDRFRVRTTNDATPDDGDYSEYHPGVRDTIKIKVIERDHFAAKSSPDYEKILDADLFLSQSSRLSLFRDVRPEKGTGLRFPPRDPMTSEPTAEFVVFPWPHYATRDTGSGLPLIAELRPVIDDGAEFNKRGVVYRMLRREIVNDGEPALEHTFAIGTVAQCHRRLQGSVTMLDGDYTVDIGSEAAITSVQLDYGESLADISTVQGIDALLECTTDCPAPSVCVDDADVGYKRCGCESDEHCASGLVCDVDAKRCALNLNGLRASRDTIAPALNGEPFGANIYTYCDRDVESDRKLRLILTATPDVTTGLPRLSYQTNVTFAEPMPPTKSDAQLPGDLCMPSWAPAQPVAVKLAGAPADLIGERTCCSIECLQTDPAPAPDSCTPAASISFTGTFVRPETWEVLKNPNDNAPTPCLPLYSASDPDNDDPASVSFTRRFDSGCATDECTLSRGTDEEPLTYSLRVEPKVGSVFRSAVYDDVTIGAEIAEIGPVALDYRVLVRGRVQPSSELCESTAGVSSCALSNPAQVLMERVRIESTDAPVLPPYEYETVTLSGGNFVLPVNPGVYLVTAYPALGSQGAPSRVQVLDLRLDSSMIVVNSKGVPVADLPFPLELDVGAQTTVELSGFDKSTIAYPVDLGCWATGDGTVSFEGLALDLNSPETCYSTRAEPIGCQSRRLVFGNTKIFINQEKFVTFSTRKCE
ncbi:MAG: hypothetical protein R3A51_19930 [Nannocystaceae bacterium]|nr:hypothetical protein [Myxococcales bacterium]